jgi:hypothetical protein
MADVLINAIATTLKRVEATLETQLDVSTSLVDQVTHVASRGQDCSADDEVVLTILARTLELRSVIAQQRQLLAKLRTTLHSLPQPQPTDGNDVASNIEEVRADGKKE